MLDRVRAVQALVLGQRIGPEVPLIPGQESRRPFRRVIGGEVEQDVRVVGVTDAHPQVRLLRASRTRHPQLHARVVPVDHTRQQQPRVHQVVQRAQQLRRTPQPVAQRRIGDRHTRPSHLAGEPMHGHVIGELRGNDVGQQTRTAQAPGDRPDVERSGGRDALLRRHARGIAVPARVALLARAQNEEPGRFQVQLFGRLLTDGHAQLTAARAQLLRIGEVVDRVASLEVFGQRRAAVGIALWW